MPPWDKEREREVGETDNRINKSGCETSDDRIVIDWEPLASLKTHLNEQSFCPYESVLYFYSLEAVLKTS